MKFPKTVILFMVFILLASSFAVHAQEVSLRWSIPEQAAGAPTVQASVLESKYIALEIHGIDQPAIPNIDISCLNIETQEAGSVTLRPIQTELSDQKMLMQFAIGDQWLGLPYPVSVWALESKPMAIISGRAGHSPYHMTPAELRQEFAWTAAYMLQTARHSYTLPLGDGLLDCYFQAEIDGSAVSSQPLLVEFGRGLPQGVFERDFSAPDMTGWRTWVIDSSFIPELPASSSEDMRQGAASLLSLQAERTPAQVALVRKWDNGSAASPWIEIAMSSMIDNLVTPPRAARAYGLVSVAMYEALVAASRVAAPVGYQAPCRLEPQLTPIFPDCAATGYLSEGAIAAGAASSILSYLYPNQTEQFKAWAEEALQAQLWAGTHYPAAVELSFELGQQVAELVIERAKADGSDAVFEGEIPQGEGNWVPDEPDFGGPLEPMAGAWQPWNMVSGDQFRPAPPPAYGTPEFEAAAREVYEVGANLTVEQQRIASYWEDKKGTYTPPGHWNAIALQLVRQYGLSSQEAARLYAILNTAQADAFIAAWDAKYTYWSIRPVTAVHRLFDPNWRPYIYTPPFPSYISGHATDSGAAAEVLAYFFPEQQEQLWTWAEEAAMSRLLGGIHYRFDNDTGLAVGRQVGHQALLRAGLVKE